MRLSVALCTYNGERFLPEQLASIRGQTRPPDELVVCDDVSADRSAAIAREFAGRAPFPVRIEVNETNLGSTRNFNRAVGLCTGDVIVLADQDDVWLPHKLAALEAALAADRDAGFVFSDAQMVDEQLNPLGYALWDAVRFRPREQERFRRGAAFEALLRRYRVTGATMAFRAVYRDLVLPIPQEWVHDAWISLLISAVGRCALVTDPLIQYRQHARQQLGEKKRGLYGQYLVARTMSRKTYEAVASRYAAALERLRHVPGVGAAQLAILEKKVDHYRRRTAMRDPGAWRVPIILREYLRGNYSRFSLGWKAVAQDLFLG
ncbi:MAG: Alpha-L-Rha alpha,3-L-rhamnosyltransferase [Gemmataceae bacterium]|nr:Alpha-L-Rha alpha,3-L-rhamnosyltransferase [Gemmataceae bacterium]